MSTAKTKLHPFEMIFGPNISPGLRETLERIRKAGIKIRAHKEPERPIFYIHFRKEDKYLQCAVTDIEIKGCRFDFLKHIVGEMEREFFAIGKTAPCTS